MQDQERARLRRHKIGGRILDIGCGDGDFLAGLDDRWEKWGVDISPQAVKLATDKGIRMEPYSERWPEGFAEEAFDVIVFRGTLQHIDLPFYVLRECARMLNPGGVLAFLATPNAGSICYKLFGSLPALDPPRNWWVFSERELLNVLGRLGLKVEEVVYPYWGTPYARPLRDLLDFLLRLIGFRRGFAFPGNMMEVFARKPNGEVSHAREFSNSAELVAWLDAETA
jgi:SAM-dependent methyltransferase